MRWRELFDDLEARFEQQERAEQEADLVDLVRGERDRVAFVDRLRAHLGAQVTLDLRDGKRHRGTVLDVGRDWVLLRIPGGGPAWEVDLLVPLAAVLTAGGMSPFSLAAGQAVARRLRLGSVLRGLARDRAGVTVSLWSGAQVDGTVDRVGADHLDLAVHPADVTRRAVHVQQVCTVPFQAVASVRVRRF